MKLHRVLGVTRKTAWHLAHRIRRGFEADHCPFEGLVEIDETYIGGIEGNKHMKGRKSVGGGSKGRTAIVGIKDHETNQIATKAMPSVRRDEVFEMVDHVAEPDAKRYRDESMMCRSMSNHEAVHHGRNEYVSPFGATTNGLESNWSMLIRGYIGTCHKVNPKQLDRYENEFSGRHNISEFGTLNQMSIIARGMGGRRLRYVDLIKDSGLSSGAREMAEETQF